jgi:hypothetical protein
VDCGDPATGATLSFSGKCHYLALCPDKAIAFAMKSFYSAILVVSVLITTAYADCVKNRDGNVMCGEGSCIKDRGGKVYCTGLGGGIQADNSDKIYCGIGECVIDGSEIVWCSVIQGGGAATDSHEKVKCYGGCERGKRELCTEGKKAQ